MNRPASVPASVIAALAAGLATSGCSVFKSNEEAQAIVTQRVAGMPAGTFFDTYGRWKNRVELPNGGTTYQWQSSVGSAAPGIYGLDERTCFMRIFAGKNGRIESATIMNDNPGRVSTSRCGEMFKAP
ncbi:MAG: hypothetical protein ABIO71_06945 [Caldimonas sp.]